MPRSFLRERARDRHDLDRAAAARREHVALPVDQAHHRGADRAEPGKTDFERRDHRRTWKSGG